MARYRELRAKMNAPREGLKDVGRAPAARQSNRGTGTLSILLIEPKQDRSERQAATGFSPGI